MSGSPPGGGAPRLLLVATVYNMLRDFLLPYADHYRGRGWVVDALARRDETFEECAPRFDRALEIGWSRHPRELRDLPTQVRAVRGIVERGRYDIVHVHTPIAGFLTRFALRGPRARGGPAVIYTAHGFHYQPEPGSTAARPGSTIDRWIQAEGSRARNAAYLSAERLAARWTDHLVVINRDDERAALRHRLLPRERVHYTPGIGIDVGAYAAEAVGAGEVRRARDGLGLREGDSLFLMIAEFTLNKRHADVLRALALLGRPDAHLAIAGRDGPALAPTLALVERLGLRDRVHVLGFRDDIPALIRASAASVLVSAREGLPRSVMESLCLGTPVIGTRIRGIADLLEGGGGRLVGVGDVGAIRDGLAWAIERPDEARAAGEAGRRRMGDYDLRRVIALHDRLYGRALAGRRAGTAAAVAP